MRLLLENIVLDETATRKKWFFVPENHVLRIACLENKKMRAVWEVIRLNIYYHIYSLSTADRKNKKRKK
jgi:hypothetical protein